MEKSILEECDIMKILSCFQRMFSKRIFKDTHFPHEYISIEYYPRRTQVERLISWFNRRGDSIEYLREYSLNDNY